jgi:hypothetical protein
VYAGFWNDTKGEYSGMEPNDKHTIASEQLLAFMTTKKPCQLKRLNHRQWERFQASEPIEG